MKKVLYFFVLLFFVSCAGNAQSKEENKVAAAVESLKKAMVDGERIQLDKIAAAQLSYGHSSGKVEDKTSFVEAIVSGKSDFVSIDLTEQVITISGKTAMVRHKLSAQTNDGGKPGSVNLGIFLVFQKQHGDWKLIGRQAFKL